MGGALCRSAQTAPRRRPDGRHLDGKGLQHEQGEHHRQDGQRGYAAGFQGLVDYIDGLLPRNELIGKAFREERPLYPSIAIRELIANALIHQDMTITGAGPLIELFSDRMEITNPGAPLVSPDRFLDSPPRSRNEALASLMRRMKLCEEQGTGIDKVILLAHMQQISVEKGLAPLLSDVEDVFVLSASDAPVPALGTPQLHGALRACRRPDRGRSPISVRPNC